MLKGTMKIELTDVKTGQTETVLEHNMLTNALANIFKPLGLVKDPSRMYESFAPYYQKLLGGLLLFDTNIEENADMLYPPAEAQLVGSAVYGQQNNTTGKVRGSFNQTERAEPHRPLHEICVRFPDIPGQRHDFLCVPDPCQRRLYFLRQLECGFQFGSPTCCHSGQWISAVCIHELYQCQYWR